MRVRNPFVTLWIAITTDPSAPGELLTLVAAVERESEHPLADAIVRYADEHGASSARVSAFEAVPGQGAVATVNGHRLAVGNERLMQREHIAMNGLAAARDLLSEHGQTAVVAAIDGRAAAVIGIADAVRPTAAAAVAALREAGIEVVMLTGDNQATAERIANMLGIDTVIAEILPADKANRVASGRWASRCDGR